MIESVWEVMSKSQKDGLGAAWSAGGEIGYVKSSAPFIFPNESGYPPFADGVAAYFGHLHDRPSDGGPLIIHGRTATSEKSLMNCHPMLWAEQGVGDDERITHAVIHNGVVDSGDYYNHLTTCDSELIMHAFAEGGIDSVAKSISGRYAFASLEVGRKGESILNVVRDDKACLHVGILPNGGYVFATTQTLIERVGGRYLEEFKKLTCVCFVNGALTKVTEFVKTAVAPVPPPATSSTPATRTAAQIAAAHNADEGSSSSDSTCLMCLPGETNKQRKKRLNRLRHQKKVLQHSGTGPHCIAVPRDRDAHRPHPKRITSDQDLKEALDSWAEAERVHLPGYVAPEIPTPSRAVLMLREGQL